MKQETRIRLETTEDTIINLKLRLNVLEQELKKLQPKTGLDTPAIKPHEWPSVYNLPALENIVVDREYTSTRYQAKAVFMKDDKMHIVI